MNILRYEPHNLFHSAFDRLADDLMGFLPTPTGEGFLPRVDIVDEGKQLALEVEVPGIEKDALKVEVHQGVLTISGEKQATKLEDNHKVHRSERVYGAFKRSFTLPDNVNGEEVQAAFKNGVLRITLPKRPELAPKVVEINA